MRVFKLIFVTAMLLIAGHVAAGETSNLKVVLLDSKTGKPLHSKTVCVSFNPSPRGNGVDKPNVCGTTDGSGAMNVSVPTPVPLLLHVAVLTNDLLPCFPIPHAYSVADVLSNGAVAPNTCGTGTKNPALEPNHLFLFSHQMTIWEVLKSMWHEI